ncbi:fluoroquinolone export ABC transporter permease subunit [Pseudalkalibacillus sp. R45]|uniref:fluoroquinolone export ABC transporter permease subunit n=1 Tax=Pseudalkalibacillus sp. R45 TaxID=3457433 RepID=UPI003FCC31D7
MRLLTSIAFDVRYQFRHGFYAAYALISLIYIFILITIPEQWMDPIFTLIIFSDPSFLGAFFVGGIVLLEKGDHILDNLFVTPYTIREYLLSKALSLALLTILSTLIIKWTVFGFRLDWFFLSGIVLTSMFFTLLGIVIGAKVDTLNQYLLLSSVYVTPFALPILLFFEVVDWEWIKIIPSYASLLLIDRQLSIPEALVALFYLCLSIFLLLPYAYRCFHHNVVLKKKG